MYESRTRILLIPLMGQYRYLQNTNPEYFIAYKFPRIARHKISQDTCMVKISLRYALGVIKSYTKIVGKMMHFSEEKLYPVYLSPVFSSSLPVRYFSLPFFLFPLFSLPSVGFPLFLFKVSPFFSWFLSPVFLFPLYSLTLAFSYPVFLSKVLSFPISSFSIFVFPFLPFSTLDGYQFLLRRNSWTKSRQKS